MQSAERQSETPDFKAYFEGKTPKEGLFNILKAYSEGQMTGEELVGMAGMYINDFPPLEYIADRANNVASNDVRMLMVKTNSPAEFAETELFQKIMDDPTVTARFVKAGKPEAPSLPEQAKGWRARLKGIFGIKKADQAPK